MNDERLGVLADFIQILQGKNTKDNSKLSLSSSKSSYCQPQLAFASDSVELVFALIPLPAASPQVSERQLLSRWQFLHIAKGFCMKAPEVG